MTSSVTPRWRVMAAAATTNWNDEGDWYGANECGSASRPPTPAGTAPTLPAPWRRHQQQYRRGRYRVQCQYVLVRAGAAATPPTSPMRSCGRPVAPSAAYRPTPIRPKSSTSRWAAVAAARPPTRTRSTARSAVAPPGGRRRQQHQRVLVGAGQLPERDRGGGDHLGRCTCQPLQLRYRHRHLGTGPEHPVHPQHRAPPMGSATYASYNGTSMAAPHVAGVVALMQSVAPSPLSPAQVESIIKSTARPLPGACSGGCGAGIIDANAAVAAAINGGGNPIRGNANRNARHRSTPGGPRRAPN